MKDLAAEVNQLHSEITSELRISVEKAVRIGELLEQERRQHKRGTWLVWLATNLKFSQQTANRYMWTFRKREKLLNVSNLAEAYRIALPGRKPKTKTIKRKLRWPSTAPSADQAAELWLQLFDSVPERMRPAIAIAAARWTKTHAKDLARIEAKFGDEIRIKLNET